MTSTDLVPYTNPTRPLRIVFVDEYAFARPSTATARAVAEVMRAAQASRQIVTYSRIEPMPDGMLAALDTAVLAHRRAVSVRTLAERFVLHATTATTPETEGTP